MPCPRLGGRLIHAASLLVTMSLRPHRDRLNAFAGAIDPLASANAFRGWVALIVLVGLVARLVRVFADHDLWLDEAMVALNLEEREYVGLMESLNYYQLAPIGFLWLSDFFYQLFGPHEWAVRLGSTLCSVGSLLLLYPVWKIICGLDRDSREFRIAAMIFVGLGSLSPIMIHYGNNLKPYAIDLFATFAMVYGVKSIQCPRGKGYFIALVGSVLCFSTYTAGFAIFAVVMAECVRFVREGKLKASGWLVAGGFCAFLAFVFHAAIAFLFNPIRNATGEMLGEGKYLSINEISYFVLVDNLSIIVGFLQELLSHPGAVYTALLCLVGLAQMFVRRDFSLMVFCLVPPLLIFGFNVLGVFPLAARVNLWLLPSLFIMLSFAGIYFFGIQVRNIKVIGIVFVTFLFVPLTIQVVSRMVNPVNENDLTALVERMHDDVHVGDGVLVDWLSKPVYEIYARWEETDSRLVPVEPFLFPVGFDHQRATMDTLGTGRIWLIRADATVGNPDQRQWSFNYLSETHEHVMSVEMLRAEAHLFEQRN